LRTGDAAAALAIARMRADVNCMLNIEEIIELGRRMR
jgi:hypothetical protein